MPSTNKMAAKDLFGLHPRRTLLRQVDGSGNVVITSGSGVVRGKLFRARAILARLPELRRAAGAPDASPGAIGDLAVAEASLREAADIVRHHPHLGDDRISTEALIAAVPGIEPYL